MKIDFNSSFSEISRITNAPVKQTPQGQGEVAFKKLLSSIAGNPTQQNGIIKDPPPPPPSLIESRSSDGGPKASFRFPEPEMKSPAIQPLKVDTSYLELQTPAIAPAHSVKTPSVLSVKRVTEQMHSSVAAEGPRASLGPTMAPPIPIARQDVEKVEPKPIQQDERVAQLSSLLKQVGVEHGIDPALGMAVMQAESGFNPAAVSSDGHFSKGLFQLLDGTGQELHANAGLTSSYDPFNPEQNVELGVRYMRRLHDYFSEGTKLTNNYRTTAAANIASLEKLAVASFNAGEGRVASAQQRAEKAGVDPSVYEQVAPYLPDSTQDYVQKVMKYRLQFEGDFVG
jgi:hypothetical protein